MLLPPLYAADICLMPRCHCCCRRALLCHCASAVAMAIAADTLADDIMPPYFTLPMLPTLAPARYAAYCYAMPLILRDAMTRRLMSAPFYDAAPRHVACASAAMRYYDAAMMLPAAACAAFEPRWLLRITLPDRAEVISPCC